MIKISAVSPSVLEKAWLEAGPYLSDAIDRVKRDITLADLHKDVADGKEILWVAFDDADGSIVGAVTTSFRAYPQRLKLFMGFCGGKDMDAWFDPMLETLKRFAKGAGCSGIEFAGRRGWKGWMPDWDNDIVLYQKDI